MLPKHSKVMLGIFAAIVIGAFVFGSAPAALLQFGLLALCPLMMLFMHGGHGGHGKHGGQDEHTSTPAGASSPTSTADDSVTRGHQHH